MLWSGCQWVNLENFIKRWISLFLKPSPGLCLWLLPLWARLMLIHGAISIWGPSLTMVNDNTILYTVMWAYMDEGGVCNMTPLLSVYKQSSQLCLLLLFCSTHENRLYESWSLCNQYQCPGYLTMLMLSYIGPIHCICGIFFQYTGG